MTAARKNEPLVGPAHKTAVRAADPGARERLADGLADEDLVALAVAGDRLAFEKLVGRYQRPLINYLHRLTGLRDGAMDLAQDVFIKVYLSLGTFDPRYRFTTWLYRIASNCAIDHLRKRQLPTCPIGPPALDDGRSQSEPNFPGADPTPDDMLRFRELEGRLETAIADLPVHYRQLILLRRRHHCRYDEIARITRLPIGTVKNRIFRAREVLRSRLADVLDSGV
jgi:RNA polymerase sigma-70 factor, ECF subfamily